MTIPKQTVCKLSMNIKSSLVVLELARKVRGMIMCNSISRMGRHPAVADDYLLSLFIIAYNEDSD